MAMGGASPTGNCLTDAAQLPAIKGLRDSDYYQQTSAAKGTITDVDFAWDASKNPGSGPPQRSQQAVSPEVPAGFERMQVYTPPGYDPNGTTRYPVLYLNHGTGDTYKVWLAASAGTGNVDRNPGYGARIYENLLDKHATVPMIIVTAYIDDCGPLDAPSLANVKDDYGCTPKFKTAIIPKIDSDYRTIAERAGRAMAGLSRGGYVSLQTGVPNMGTLFSELYVYSAAYGAAVAPDLTGYMKALGTLVSDPSQTNTWLNQPLYIAIGSSDTTVNGSADSMNLRFVNAGIKTLHVVTDGGHEWGNWRRYLHQSLQVMFRNRNGCQ
jgi:enterochelin esterase family protein